MALVLPECNGDPIREEFLLGPVDRLGGLVVIAPAHRAGFFSLKLLILSKIFAAIQEKGKLK
jgi:hypothetical protein